ncbi:hypothetical protein HK100_005818 [Physocladia obscura]|uniref:Uncharacterized protein n=1 Tax=Physocladia obscura TaxID=109957 RepID=A0AAD5XMN1_9FUNG|nr:hypothetical protein HK100_005818 [Physocladia obscura]
MAHSSTGSSPTSYATTISAANNSSNSGAGQLSNGIIGAIAIGATLAAALILFVAWLCVIRCINHRKHAVGDRKIEARGEEIALDSRNTGGGGGRKSYVFKGMGEMYAQTMRAGVERVVTVTRRMTGSTKSGDGVGGRGSGEILGTGGKNGSTRSKESSKLGNSFAYVELEDSAITSGVGGSGSGGEQHPHGKREWLERKEEQQQKRQSFQIRKEESFELLSESKFNGAEPRNQNLNGLEPEFSSANSFFVSNQNRRDSAGYTTTITEAVTTATPVASFSGITTVSRSLDYEEISRTSISSISESAIAVTVTGIIVGLCALMFAVSILMKRRTKNSQKYADADWENEQGIALVNTSLHNQQQHFNSESVYVSLEDSVSVITNASDSAGGVGNGGASVGKQFYSFREAV